MAAYKTKNWADFKLQLIISKIVNNVGEKRIDGGRIHNNKLRCYYFISSRQEDYEMVVTDEKETWVNFGIMERNTKKSSGKVYQIPIHTTAIY
jgi:hypothetical protein